MTSTPEPVDERLLAAHDLAVAALREITAESSIGEPAGYQVEDGGVVSLRFENRLPGYPGWFWTVSLARVDDAEPTVLEVELLPGDGALLAPDWTPWAVRLADYQAAQAALAEAAEAAGEDDADELDDGDIDDEDDDDDLGDPDDEDDELDVDGSSILHAGDVDGVDIDELDTDADSDDEDEEDDFDADADSDDEDEEDDFDADADEDDFDDDDALGERVEGRYSGD